MTSRQIRISFQIPYSITRSIVEIENNQIAYVTLVIERNRKSSLPIPKINAFITYTVARYKTFSLLTLCNLKI